MKKLETANKQIRHVTYFGVVVNVLLSAVKFFVGIMCGSIALVADGVHSLSDMVTDIIVLVGVKFGSKEPDMEHPYGHGRFETFSALLVGIVLALAGGLMIYQACVKIARIHNGLASVSQVGFAVFWVAVVSVIVKEFLYRITKTVAMRTDSAAMFANAWHHRSDAFSSIAVIIGFAVFKLGYIYGDQVAAVIVGLMIMMVAAKVIGGCLHEFAERGVDIDTVRHIEGIIEAEQRIRHWHKLRTRSVGREIFIDLHILVDPALNICQAHEIAESLEGSIHDQLTRPVNITVHIEPDRPELRK